MTTRELEERIVALEKRVKELQERPVQHYHYYPPQPYIVTCGAEKMDQPTKTISWHTSSWEVA